MSFDNMKKEADNIMKEFIEKLFKEYGVNNKTDLEARC